MVKTLYLLGSNDTFPLAIGEFIEACGGYSARLIILLPGGDMSVGLFQGYEECLEKHAVNDRRYYPSTEVEVEDPETLIRSASGIIMGGGSSLNYYRRYAAGPLKHVIATAYGNGVPVMACCGSVMIIGDVYPIFQEGEGEEVECRPALGLLSGCVFGVHFDVVKSMGHMIDNMTRAGIAEGLGLGVKSWAVFKESKIVKAVGDVYRIRMTDAGLGGGTVEKASFDGRSLVYRPMCARIQEKPR